MTGAPFTRRSAGSSPPAIRAGVVSVVLVNYRGAEDTITCLRSFASLDWPADRLELLVVDNASGDGSAERIRAAVPQARVIESEVNRGFAGGCNLGAAEASGESVAEWARQILLRAAKRSVR